MKRTLAQSRKLSRQRKQTLAAEETALRLRANLQNQEAEHDGLITYDDYIKEREHLSKYEATNYENFEKQILTLAAAFLAFSVSFLAVLRNKPTLLPLTWHSVLIASWICFAASVLSIVVSFPVHAIGIRSDVKDVEQLYDGKDLSETMNRWYIAGYLLYGAGGLSFMAGLILLLIFCAHNVNTF
jgi:hypothetical protein